jgi:hypothetical protein
MDKKLTDKLVKNIEWGHAVQGGWEGSITLKDGYRITLVMAPSVKMREAKAYIKEHLLEEAELVATERNTALI